jgi:hypothetical protein
VGPEGIKLGVTSTMIEASIVTVWNKKSSQVDFKSMTNHLPWQIEMILLRIEDFETSVKKIVSSGDRTQHLIKSSKSAKFAAPRVQTGQSISSGY